VEIKLLKRKDCFYAKELARAHGFNTKNNNPNGPPWNEILAIMCWFGTN
jgi:hypothetical protein